MKWAKIAAVCVSAMVFQSARYASAQLPAPQSRNETRADRLVNALRPQPSDSTLRKYYSALLSEKALYPEALHYQLQRHDKTPAIVAAINAAMFAEQAEWLTTPEEKDSFVQAVFRGTQGYMEQLDSGEIPSTRYKKQFQKMVMDAVVAAGQSISISRGPVEVNVGSFVESIVLTVNAVNFDKMYRDQQSMLTKAQQDASVFLLEQASLDPNDLYRITRVMRANPEIANRIGTLLETHGIAAALDIDRTDSELLADPRYADFKTTATPNLLLDIQDDVIRLKTLIEEGLVSNADLIAELEAQLTTKIQGSLKLMLEGNSEQNKLLLSVRNSLTKGQANAAARAAMEAEIKQREFDQRLRHQIMDSTVSMLASVGRLTGDHGLTEFANQVNHLTAAIKLFDQANSMSSTGSQLATAAATVNYAQAALIVAELVITSQQDAAPSPEQLIFEAVEQMRQEMHQRFDIVHEKVDAISNKVDQTLYHTLVSFETLSGQLAGLTSIADVNQDRVYAVSAAVAQLADEVHAAFGNLEEMIEEGFHRDFENAAAEYVHRLHELEGRLTREEFKEALMLFKAYATRHSGDAIALGPSRTSISELSDAGVSKWLSVGDIYKHTDNIRRALTFRGVELPDELPAERIRSASAWFVSAVALQEIVDRHPEFRESIRPEYYDSLIASGNEIVRSLRMMYSPNITQILIDAYLENLRSTGTTYRQLVEVFESRWLAGLSAAKKPSGDFADFPRNFTFSVAESEVIVEGETAKLKLPSVVTTDNGSKTRTPAPVAVIKCGSRQRRIPTELLATVLPKKLQVARELARNDEGRFPEARVRCVATWTDLRSTSDLKNDYVHGKSLLIQQGDSLLAYIARDAHPPESGATLGKDKEDAAYLYFAPVDGSGMHMRRIATWCEKKRATTLMGGRPKS